MNLLLLYCAVRSNRKCAKTLTSNQLHLLTTKTKQKSKKTNEVSARRSSLLIMTSLNCKKSR